MVVKLKTKAVFPLCLPLEDTQYSPHTSDTKGGASMMLEY